MAAQFERKFLSLLRFFYWQVVRLRGVGRRATERGRLMRIFSIRAGLASSLVVGLVLWAVDISSAQFRGFPPVGGQMSGGQMMGGQLMGGQILGGQMMGGQMVGGQMTGGQMRGGQMTGGQMFGGGSIKSYPGLQGYLGSILGMGGGMMGAQMM